MSRLPQSIQRDDHDDPQREADEENDAKHGMPTPPMCDEREQYEAGRTTSGSCPKKPRHSRSSLMMMKKIRNSTSKVADSSRREITREES